MLKFLLFSLLASLIVGGQHVVLSEMSDKRKLAIMFERLFRVRLPLYRRTRNEWGTEYVYRLPFGLSHLDVLMKRHVIEDGLNKDVTIDFDGMLILRVFDRPLPTFVEMDESWLSDDVVIGITHDRIIRHDFNVLPHMIVAGATQYGKTVFLKSMISQLLHDDVILHLFDLKGGLAFNRFRDRVASVSTNEREAYNQLQHVKQAMNDRMVMFQQQGFENVKETKCPQVFVIVDEAAELTPTGKKDIKRECQHILSHIARVGGGLGFRLIFCTQYPTADTLPRQIKQNCDAKLCFRLPTEIASRVVLDSGGAEKLPQVKGRAIYQTDEQVVLQIPYVEVENRVNESRHDDLIIIG